MLTKFNPLAASLLLGACLAAPAFAGAKILEANKSVLPISATGHDRFYSVAFDKEGNYYAAGSVADAIDRASDAKFVVAKFLADGSLDKTFGTDGYAIHNVVTAGDAEVARNIVVTAEGKLVVAGPVEVLLQNEARDRNIAVIRLNTDGSLDKTFGTDGVATVDFAPGAVNGDAYLADGYGSLNVDAEGRFIIHGSQKRDGATDLDFAVVRLNADGSTDQTFGTAGKTTLDHRGLGASPKSTLFLPDGKIVVTGYARDTVGPIPVIFRLDTNGVLDTTFGTDGVFAEAVLANTTEVYSAVLVGDSIITNGYGRNSAAESIDFVSLKLSVDGKLDTSWGAGGYVQIDAAGFNDNGRNMAALPDGRVILVGGGRSTEPNVDGMITILDSASAEPDYAFGDSGTQLLDFGTPNDFLWGAAVSPAGDKIVAVGIKGVGTQPGNDDATVVILPIEKAAQ